MATAALELLIELRDQASKGLEAIGGSLGKIGETAVGVFGAGLIEGGISAITDSLGSIPGFAADAAQGINDFQASLGASRAEAEHLGSIAQQIFGNNWGDNLTDVNQSLIAVRQQMKGLADSDLQNVTQKALALRDTFGVDIAESTNAANTLMHDFGITSDQAFDFITKGYQSGLDASGDFLDSIGEYSPQLQAMGADAGQFFSIMESGQQGGVLGLDKASDLLKETRLRISEETGATKSALESIGIDSNKFYADLRSGSLTGIQAFDMIRQHVASIEDPVKRQTAAVALMGTQYEDMGPAAVAAIDITKFKLQDLGGATDSLNAKYNNLGSVWEGIKRSALVALRPIGDGLLEVANTFMPVVQAGFTELSAALPGIMGGVGDVFNNIVASAQPFVDWLQVALPQAMAFVSENAETFKGALIGIGIALAAMSFVGLVTALTALLNPVTLIIAAAGLLGAAWSSNFLGIQDATAAVWAYLQPIFTELVTWFQTNLPIALAALSQLWTGTLLPALQVAGDFIVTTVVPALTELWNWLSTNIPAAIAAAKPTFDAIVTTLGTIATTIQTALVSAFTWLQNTWTSLSTSAATTWSTISTAVSTAVNVISTIVLALQNTLLLAWNAIQTASAIAWNAIAAVVGPPLEQAAGVVSGAVASIQSTITTAWEAVKSATEPVWTAISAAVSTAVETIRTGVDGFVSFINSTWSSAMSAAETATSGPWASIQSVITGVTDAIQTAVKTATDIVQTAMTTAWSVIVAASNNDFGSIPGIISKAWDDIKKTFSTGVEEIKKTFSGVVGDMKSIGSDIVSGIQDGISGAWGRFEKWIGDQVAKIPEPIRTALGMHSPSRVMAQMVGVPIAQGIGAGFGQAFPKVEKSLIDGIAGLSESAAKALDAGAKAISAAASYSGPGGSGLSGFLTAFADMAIQFNDAALMLGGRILGTATRFAETIGKVAGSIGPAVEGLEALQAFVAPSRSAMLTFTAAMSDILTMFKEVAYALNDSAIKYAAKFAESAGKILGVVEVGAKAIAALADLPTLAPGTTQTFANKVAWIVSRLAEVGAWMNGSALSNAATFAEGAGKVLAMVGTGVDAFTKLNTFVKPIDGIIQLFTNKVAWLVSRFAEVGAWMRGPILSAAVAFADGAATVLGVLETGVAGFAALNTFVRPLPGITQAFTTAVYWLITRFVEAGAGLRAQGLAATTAFADAAGKVTGMIGSAVDAFAKLREFVTPAQNAIAAFGTSLRAVLATLIQVMKSFTAEAVAAAAAFGEGAGKAVAFIGNAVDGFTKLADFQGVGQAAIDAFGVALRATLQNLISVMNGFAADAIAAAGKFGDGAGKAVSFIGNAVGSFIKLAEFTGVGQSAIDAFGVGLRATLQALVAVAQSFAVDAVAAAAVFGEGVGKAVAFIGSAVDSLTKLADFQAPADDAVKAFFLSIGGLMEIMDGYSVYFNDRMYATTKAFADGVHGAIVNLGSIAESMSKLSDFKAPAEKAISAFFLSIGSLMEMMDGYSVYFNERMYATTKAFVDGVRGAIGNLGGIADSLGKLVDFEAPADAAMKAFLRAIGGLMEMLDGMSADINTRMITTAITFTGGIKAVIGQLQGALQAFATLGETSGSGKTVTAMMQSLQSLVAQMNAYLPPNATTIGQNTMVGLMNGIISQRGALITTMVNTVMAAVMAARQTLGIASPSKVFEQIGQYAGAGLQGGMAAMQPAVATAGAGLGMAAVGGASGGAGGGSAGGRGGDVHITIQNVNVPNGRGPLTERDYQAIGDQIFERMGSERSGR